VATLLRLSPRFSPPHTPVTGKPMKISAVKVREAWMNNKNLSFTEPSNKRPIEGVLDALNNWNVKSVDDDLARNCMDWVDGVSLLHGVHINGKV
jgi:hypothetical protein